MNHDKHKVSLELAKQLKEAGYPQDQSEWYWVDDGTKYHRYKISNQPLSQDIDNMVCQGLSAPTVAEGLEILPARLIIKNKDFRLLIYKYGEDSWGVGYRTEMGEGLHGTVGNGLLVNAVFKMWLWLKENGYIKED